jgi:SOS-response transcriptional repressor LexA
VTDETGERILAFVRKFREKEGYAPTIREIAAGCGGLSVDTVHRHLKHLERVGRVTWGPGSSTAKARTLQVIE